MLKVHWPILGFCSKLFRHWFIAFFYSFQEQPKKYRLVELEQTSKPVVKVNFDLESKIPSKLPAEVQDLLKDMVSFLAVLYDCG